PRQLAIRVEDDDLPVAVHLANQDAVRVGLRRPGPGRLGHRRTLRAARRSASRSTWPPISSSTVDGSNTNAGSLPTIFSRAFSRRLPAPSAAPRASARTAV